MNLSVVTSGGSDSVTRPGLALDGQNSPESTQRTTPAQNNPIEEPAGEEIEHSKEDDGDEPAGNTNEEGDEFQLAENTIEYDSRERIACNPTRQSRNNGVKPRAEVAVESFLNSDTSSSTSTSESSSQDLGNDLDNVKSANPLTISHKVLRKKTATENYDYTYPEFKSKPGVVLVGAQCGFALEEPEAQAPTSEATNNAHADQMSNNDANNHPSNDEHLDRADLRKIVFHDFPPPTNSAYNGLGENTSEGYAPQYLDAFDNALEEARHANNNESREYKQERALAVAEATTSMDNTGSDTLGEMLAANIDFDQKAWVEDIPGASGPMYPAEEQRSDFIKALDQGAAIEYCAKCDQIHIPPGSPITLPERDTCGAHLPGWFPSETSVKPWKYFRDMMNEYVRLCEIQQGFNHAENPDRKVWNLEFHNNSRKWLQLGRAEGRGGWWKCRRGPDATSVERNCSVCHSQDAKDREAEQVAQKGGKSVAERIANIEAWCNELVAAAGKRDKQIALAMIRADGIPQHFGIHDTRNGDIKSMSAVDLPRRVHLTPEQMLSPNIFLPKQSKENAATNDSQSDNNSPSGSST